VNQGFRHAATLLLVNRIRAIPGDATAASIGPILSQLAEDLVALCVDTRVSADAKPWLIDEYARAIRRLPHTFDVDAAEQHAANVFERVAAERPEIVRRDLFLIYVPEDRLPIAAPLAIELTKRRISVAFSGYEVETIEQVENAVTHGLTHHGAGVLLRTRAFDRWQLPSELLQLKRFRVVDAFDLNIVNDLASWASRLRFEA
jgi:hypothetical protein